VFAFILNWSYSLKRRGCTEQEREMPSKIKDNRDHDPARAVLEKNCDIVSRNSNYQRRGSL